MTFQEKRETLVQSKRTESKLLIIAFLVILCFSLLSPVIGMVLLYSGYDKTTTRAVFEVLNIFSASSLIFVWYSMKSAINHRNLQREYESELKDKVFRSVFCKHLDNCVYGNQCGLSEDAFRLTKIVPETYNVYKSEDRAMGEYKGIPVIRSDLFVQKTGDSINDRTHTLYKGQIYIFSFKDNFPCNLQIIDKKNTIAFDRKYQFGRKSQNKAKMTNPKFNKLFDVYITQQDAVNDILTPELMSMIIAVRERLGREASFLFSDNQLIICLNAPQGSYQLDYKGTASEEERKLKSEITDEITCALSIVDELMKM